MRRKKDSVSLKKQKKSDGKIREKASREKRILLRKDLPGSILMSDSRGRTGAVRRGRTFPPSDSRAALHSRRRHWQDSSHTKLQQLLYQTTNRIHVPRRKLAYFHLMQSISLCINEKRLKNVFFTLLLLKLSSYFFTMKLKNLPASIDLIYLSFVEGQIIKRFKLFFFLSVCIVADFITEVLIILI